MSTPKKSGKPIEDTQAALQSLIAQGRKEGMVRSADLNAILEKMDMTPEKIEEVFAVSDFITIHVPATANTKGMIDADAIAALNPGVYIFGHNHIQTWGDFGRRVLINPGSVGLPLDCGEAGAAYSLMTIENGAVTIEERRVPYDLECLIGKIRQSGQYTAARVWTEIIFSEWRTVREKVYQFLHHCERYAASIGDDRRPFAKDTWEAAYAEWVAHAREWHPELFAFNETI